MSNEDAESHEHPDAEIREIIDSPTTPIWAKDLAKRLVAIIDPVDAASGLNALAEAFERRADAILRRESDA